MKKGLILLMVLFISQSCASKNAQATNTKEEKKEEPVISVFGQPAAPKTETTPPIATPSPSSPATNAITKPESVAPAVSSNDSPKEVIQNYTAELQTIRDEPNMKKKKRDRQISEKVRKFFDFGSLAQMSLSSHWDQLSSKTKVEFSDLFTRLIEKSYLQKSRSLVGNYKLSFGNEIINGNKASVTSSIYKDDADFDITYELHKVGNTWMINNIIFDQVNLVKNYQSQFNRIIAKSNVDELMKLLRKKLNENSSDVDAAL